MTLKSRLNRDGGIFFLDKDRLNILLNYARRQDEFLQDIGYDKALKMIKVKITVEEERK